MFNPDPVTVVEVDGVAAPGELCAQLIYGSESVAWIFRHGRIKLYTGARLDWLGVSIAVTPDANPVAARTPLFIFCTPAGWSVGRALPVEQPSVLTDTWTKNRAIVPYKAERLSVQPLVILELQKRTLTDP